MELTNPLQDCDGSKDYGEYGGSKSDLARHRGLEIQELVLDFAARVESVESQPPRGLHSTGMVIQPDHALDDGIDSGAVVVDCSFPSTIRRETHRHRCPPHSPKAMVHAQISRIASFSFEAVPSPSC